MIALYLICLIAGGGLVLLSSLFGGDHDSDADGQLGHDAGAGGDAGGHDIGGHDIGGHDIGGHDIGGHDIGGHDIGGHDAGGHDIGGHDAGGHDLTVAPGHAVAPASTTAGSGPWLPFLSLQFWTFSTAFFGATGLALAVLTSVTLPIQVLAAISTGLASGLGVSYGLRAVRRSQVSSTVRSGDLIGAQGRVVLPISRSTPGKISVEVKERRIDQIAVTDEEIPLAPGEMALIIAVEEGQVRVVRAQRLLAE